MFFIISKILHFLIAPFFWILLLFILSYIFKKKSRKRLLRILAFSILFIFSNAFIYDEVNRAWELPAMQKDELSHYKCGIVLSGMVSYDTDFSRINFHGSIDRLLQALVLYKEGYIEKILITGGSGSILYDELDEAQILKNYLVSIGFPPQDILTESKSRNTVENARYTKEYLSGIGLDKEKHLLITSAYHMRRAKGVFEKEGFDIDCFSTDRKAGPRKFHFEHLVLPQVWVLNSWVSLNHEIIGYLSYCMFDYI